MTFPQRSLRLLYIEDNPLLVFHAEAMIEELGHTFVGFFASFAELQGTFDALDIDGALVDIDLADGRTGPAAAAWLLERGIPSIFVTGQSSVAAEYPQLVLGTITKPMSADDLAEHLQLFRDHSP
jgi:AmiR/NasT family two-component response regulator